jgi:LmbE family N-acetylglucosaminyl deacetylase
MSGLTAFDQVKRLIVVAAHPDDLETMCGGTIALLVQRGVTVFSVNCTLGDIGSTEPAITRAQLAATRLAETEAAGRILGVTQNFNLLQPDGELVPDLDLRAEIARLFRLTQADTLMTFDPFWTGQIHPDHRAAGQAALDAYMPAKMPLYRPDQLADEDMQPGRLERIYLFATERDPDIIIDVTAIYTTKLAACLAHQSQFPQGEENLDWMKEIDRQNAANQQATYAERFKEIRVW